jgi:bacillopeptidase F (M6 metalloprotease family)
MTDKHRARIKKFGDRLAKDSGVVAHCIVVWYKNGDTENNWSGIGSRPHTAGLSVVDQNIEDAEIVSDE